MIYIYCDFDHFVDVTQDEQTWVVQYTSEYIPLRQKLRHALDDEDHDFTVYVCSSILTQWLADLRDYGEKVVLWSFVDARRQAQDYLGFPLPDVFDTSAIQALHLLSLQAPVYTLDPEGWLLKQFLGTIWEVVEPETEHLGKFVLWATSFTGNEHPALRQLAEKRLNQWSLKNERYTYFLRNEWHRAGNNILLRWAFRRYPASFIEQLGLDETPVVDIAKDQESYLTLLQKCKPTNELRRYWNLFFAQQEGLPSEHAHMALSQMSGVIEDELDIMYSYLSQYSAMLSLSLLDHIRKHFHLLSTSKAALDHLEGFIPPPIPAQPDSQWSPTRWLQWVTEEYMPYFTWVIRTNQSRQILIPFVDCFSDWFVGEYPRLLFDPHAPLHLIYQHYLCQLKRENPNVVIIWGVIDGLTWWQGKLLIDEFMQRQLYVHQLEPTLVALPSITSVSKRALVRGYVTSTDDQRSIAKIAREQLVPDFGGDVIICSDPRELVSAVNTNNNPGIYVLLYNGLDTHNHESTTFTDDESVKGYLRAIADAIAATVSQTRRRGFDVHAVISSDHGSTLLPENAMRLDPPSFIQPLDDENEEGNGERRQSVTLRSRACKISHELDVREITQLKENWYILNKDEFGLTDTLLIPRGYAYAKRRPYGWLHGGATPEEAVVPFIEVHPLPLQILSPEIHFDGYLLPNRSTTVSVTITNPNPCPLSKLHFSVINNKHTVSLPHLAATNSEKLDLTLSLVLKGTQSAQLDWLLRCQIIGRAYEFTGQVTLPIRRIQNVSEVDELFGDMA